MAAVVVYLGKPVCRITVGSEATGSEFIVTHMRWKRVQLHVSIASCSGTENANPTFELSGDAWEQLIPCETHKITLSRLIWRSLSTYLTLQLIEHLHLIYNYLIPASSTYCKHTVLFLKE